MVLGAGGESISFGIRAIADTKGITEVSKALTHVAKTGGQAGKEIAQGMDRAGASFAQVEHSADQLDTSLQRTRVSAAAVGAAFGALAAAASEAGQAHLKETNQIKALERAYGGAADEVIAFTDHLQDVGIASDDAARIAALGAQSLAKNYGFTTDQITTLIERSADLSAVTFDQFGNQLDLADVMQRVAAAMRGEAESAEVLGVAMSDNALAAEAARRGLQGWTTTMTEAEKAAFRYVIFLEQTTTAQGAAAERAETTAGKFNALKVEVADLGSEFGGMLGPVGEAAAALGGISLAMPLIGAGAGKATAGLNALRTASSGSAIAMTALGVATGPVGIALGAAAAVTAIALLTRETRDLGLSADESKVSVDNLTQSISDLAKAGASQGSLALVTGLADEMALIPQIINQSVQELKDLEVQLGTLELDLTVAANTGGDTKEIEAQIRALEERKRAVEANILTDEQWTDTQADMIAVMSYDNPLNSGAVRKRIEELNAQLAAGTITLDDYAWHVGWLNDNLDTYGLTLEEVTAQETAFTKQQRRAADQEAYLAKERAEARQKALEQTKMLAELQAKVIQDVQGLGDIAPDLEGFQAGFGQAGDTIIDLFRKMDDLGVITLDIDARQALDAVSALTKVEAKIEDVEAAISNNQGDLAMWQARIGLVTDTFGANSDQIGEWTEQLQNGEITQDQFNAAIAHMAGSGGFPKLDALLAQGEITQEEYNAAVAAGTRLLQRSTGALQDEAGEIVRNIIALDRYVAEHDDADRAVNELTDSQRGFIAAMQDSAVQTYLQTLQLLFYLASIGEIPEEKVTEFIATSGQADPVIAAINADLGLIPDEKTTTVSVTYETTVNTTRGRNGEPIASEPAVVLTADDQVTPVLDTVTTNLETFETDAGTSGTAAGEAFKTGLDVSLRDVPAGVTAVVNSLLSAMEMAGDSYNRGFNGGYSFGQGVIAGAGSQYNGVFNTGYYLGGALSAGFNAASASILQASTVNTAQTGQILAGSAQGGNVTNNYTNTIQYEAHFNGITDVDTIGVHIRSELNSAVNRARASGMTGV